MTVINVVVPDSGILIVSTSGFSSGFYQKKQEATNLSPQFLLQHLVDEI
jgi:hypothetical protein